MSLSRSSQERYPLYSESGRLSLRPIDDKEISLLKNWFCNRETCELAFGIQAPWNVLESIRSEYIEELKKDKVGVLCILEDSSEQNSKPVGFVRYKLFHRGRASSARVGIVLGESKTRGRGIGKEALQTLLDYLFQERKVKKVDLDTATFNTQAQACFRSCGFVPLREVEFKGINTDWVEKRLLMRLERAGWEALRR